MIKISNIFLLFFLSISLNHVQAMEEQCSNNEEISQEAMNTLYEEFMQSISKEDFEGIKKIFEKIKENKIDINTLTGPDGRLLFYTIAKRFINFPSDFKLKAIEYFIQNGFNLNANYFKFKDGTPFTPLGKVIHDIPIMHFDSSHGPAYIENKLKLYYKLISLLLNYGANITPGAIKLAEKSRYKEEILKLFNDHKKLINEAKTNPSKNLLLEAINSNKPFIVELISQHKPELVTPEDIELAKSTSPTSISFLKKALNIQKLKKFSTLITEEELPVELVKHIGKFVTYK